MWFAILKSIFTIHANGVVATSSEINNKNVIGGIDFIFIGCLFVALIVPLCLSLVSPVSPRSLTTYYHKPPRSLFAIILLPLLKLLILLVQKKKKLLIVTRSLDITFIHIIACRNHNLLFNKVCYGKTLKFDNFKY